MKKAIIISASSDIGVQLCEHWLHKQWSIIGTYRTFSPDLKNLQRDNLELIQCDLLNEKSVNLAVEKMKTSWDILVFLPGQLEPIGNFEQVNFDSWEESVQINCLRPLRILHCLLPYKNPHSTVLFFAGGGVNNAPKNYSSYTFSKVALIKMCELLDEEMSNTHFMILGPGWVKTKIHEQILNAGYKNAGESYRRTLEKFSKNEFVPMEQVIQACDWMVENSSNIISGRNFTIPKDGWDTKKLLEALSKDDHMYKLRREKNNWPLEL